MARKSRRKKVRPEIFPVVGIGASAGGVQAFQSFFDHMPSDGGMAFLAVPHLDPTEPSHMVEILERRTAMRVVTAEDGQTIEPDTVYVVPPDRYLTVEEGGISLAKPKEARGQRQPADILFHSLGRAMRERAVAIVLSGTGTNGASGLRTVKTESGFILAQDPQTATHPDMPQAAISNGLVDEVLAPEDMPQALLRFAGHSYMKSPALDGVTSREELVSDLLSLLHTRTRHDFRPYKKSTILRRIHRRMGLKGFDKLKDYVNAVREDDEEAKALALDFMVTVTGFFRDPGAWKQLEKNVIAPLVRDCDPDRSIRVWVPGCATGEEAYSIGMLLLEQMEAAGKQLEVKIFATDTSGEALEFARNGHYPAGVVSDVPAERRKRFFDTQNNACRVKQKLRDLIVFAPQNVLQDPPFTRMDLVSCRNLLIYLDSDIQQKLLRLFHFALRERGHLFLGTAETVTGQENLFKAVSKKHCIYTSTGMPQESYVEFPLVGTRRDPLAGMHTDSTDIQPRRRLSEVAREALLRQFVPAAVVIDRGFRIFYFHGETEAYLRHPSGEPTDDLLAMVRDDLRPNLRATVNGAVRKGEPDIGRVRLRESWTMRDVVITARPLWTEQSDNGLLTVTFEEAAEPRGKVVSDEETRESPGSEELESENRLLREELRNTIKQMETSNEELKASNEEILSMNEELQSSNEELETSKEELQSFNEELNTVNAQLQSKVEELEEKTNDLNNLLNSTDIATLFLDREQRIRRYTPAMRQLMELIPSDIGRPVSNLAHRFQEGEVTKDVNRVLKSSRSVTHEIKAAQNNWYLRRTLPYRTQDDRVDGVVITFINITETKKLEEQLRRERDFAENVVRTVRQPLLVLEPDLDVQLANDAFYETFLATQENTLGKKIYELGNRQWDIPALRKLLKEVLSNGHAFDDFEVEHDFPDIGHRIMRLNGGPLEGVQLILLAIEDITERRKSERQRDTLLAELNHRVKNLLMTVQSIASQTARTSESMDGFRDAFEARLASLARGHDLLMRGNWQPALLDDLIASAISPYEAKIGERLRSKCGDVRVRPQAALAFKLILHELATNAAKYGALSTDEGLVEVTCGMQDEGSRDPKLVWRETGGPRIEEPPKKKGFGIRLIERSAAHDLDGEAELDYRTEGLCCVIAFSREHVA